MILRCNIVLKLMSSLRWANCLVVWVSMHGHSCTFMINFSWDMPWPRCLSICPKYRPPNALPTRINWLSNFWLPLNELLQSVMSQLWKSAYTGAGGLQCLFLRIENGHSPFILYFSFSYFDIYLGLRMSLNFAALISSIKITKSVTVIYITRSIFVVWCCSYKE